MNGLQIIGLFILQFILCGLVFMFIDLTFPELGMWKRFLLFLSYLAFYCFIKINNMLTGDDDF